MLEVAGFSKIHGIKSHKAGLQLNLNIMKMDVVRKWYFRVKCEQVVHVYS